MGDIFNDTCDDGVAVHGFFGTSGRRFPSSRDYAMDIACNCTKCFLNGSGRCGSPAAVKITATGGCEIYKMQKKKEREGKK